MQMTPPPLPPPAYTSHDAANEVQANAKSTPASIQYALYMLFQPAGPASAAPTASSSHAALHTHAVTHIYVMDVQLRRWAFAIRIPKKREGWKADIVSLTEKEREEPRYEVRREALARKYDFRPTNGMHNVMMPHSAFTTGSSKSFSIEAPDGQKLVWKRKTASSGSGFTATLSSQPSNTPLAQYQAHDPRLRLSEPAHAALTASVPCSSEPAQLHGFLSITPLESGTPIAARSILPVETRRPNARRRSSVSSESSSTTTSDDVGPRLCFGANRRLDIGIFAPAVVAAGFGGPFCAAAMNRRCIVGDDLANLGRTTVTTARQLKRQSALLHSEEAQADRQRSHDTDDLVSEPSALAEHWAELNRMTSVRKNNDPRPRAVDVDLLLASLMAVLAS